MPLNPRRVGTLRHVLKVLNARLPRASGNKSDVDDLSDRPTRLGIVERAVGGLESMTPRLATIYDGSPEPLKKLFCSLSRLLQVTCWALVMLLIIGPILLLTSHLGLQVSLLDYLRLLDG